MIHPIASETALDDLGAEIDDDTIAARTRTKVSLADVSIDTLEASLPDPALELTEEDREYQRFLSSLLPTEQENLSFLDEEDEEYKPEEDDDEHEDDEGRRGISKKELTELLLDSTHMTFPTPSVAQTLTKPITDSLKSIQDAPVPVDRRNDLMTRTWRRSLPDTTLALLRGRRGTISQLQCIQLASQMHKHLQLLWQSYHLLAKDHLFPELNEIRAMLLELQERGEMALKYKHTLLSKLQGGTTKTTDVESVETRTEGSLSSETGSTIEPFNASRRVTRSLTAAHAAVAHPSMFEIVGSQTVKELATELERRCAIEERDRAIQQHMLQLDTHLQMPRKRRKSTKGYSTTEDALLAHGIKRFGTQANAWAAIQTHFLPTKTTANLRHRYKYLLSPKLGFNAIKAWHCKSQPLHNHKSWLLEEDLRIARGYVELHSEKYRFARLAKQYLPHRSRLEIRKRWERLEAKFRAELVELGLPVPEKDSLDLAIAMRESFTDKLRHRMMRRKAEIDISTVSAPTPQQHHVAKNHQAGKKIPRTTADKEPEYRCRTKHLHPALFFSSWSFINPAALLNATCQHNWPSFMNESNALLKNRDLESKNELNEAVQATMLDKTDLFVAWEKKEVTRNELVHSVSKDSLISDLRLARMPQAAILMDARMARKEDDESDFEHDELLSSENDASDSEMDQIALSDADPESDSSLLEQVLSSTNAAYTSSISNNQQSLDLTDVVRSKHERMSRALEALECRMVGKSVTKLAGKPVSCSSEVLHDEELVYEKGRLNAFKTDEKDQDPSWQDGSEDEEFELIEFSSSSDENVASSDNEQLVAIATESDDSIPQNGTSEAVAVCTSFPNKKAKVLHCPTCRHVRCTCSSSERMQLLLRRMKEKRSSSSLQ
ncbi:hypothetical protein CCR75_005598 [Bremia lactucae]|uniref:Myb-like domain-containing protein n=1 Tax=Bremia lactucae TaxID=4779 RepID=A0A976FQ81_BRELC|nr:hypothetical protein CCR75_005598 [Bremia lactucae]